MADQLSIYNDALTTHLGERRLANLTEDREPRHNLDQAYPQAVKYCLEAGFWDFAMRAVMIESSTVVTPAFGYQYAFAKPADLIKQYIMSVNPWLDPPLVDMQVTDEAGYWYTNVNAIFVKYVSNDTSYGMDLNRWPESFTNFVGCYLATKIIRPTSSSQSKADDLAKTLKRLKSDALAKDAANSSISFPPRGAWASSRRSFFFQMYRQQ